MQKAGRKILYTDLPEITSENVIDVIRSVQAEHLANAKMIQYLIDFEAGEQPLTREKKTRSDINIECVDNVCNEITEFWCGYAYGNPITLVQNGDKSDKDIPLAIKLLNQEYDLVNIKGKTQELSRYMIIGGIVNVYIDVNTDWHDGESHFTYDILDPRTSFVIKSSYYTDHRTMLGVTYRRDNTTGHTYYTAFSKDTRYEIADLNTVINGEEPIEDVTKWKHTSRSGELNPLKRIPIIEYFLSYDRMGLWERQIDEMNNLNLLISDFSNDVDQNTQAIWHGNDIVFPTETIKNEDGTYTEVVKKPKTNEWIMTQTSANGSKPQIEPLAVNYDYEGMLNNIQYRRQIILQKCNVPQRNDSSGGSTGVAMSDATGWSQAETAAAKMQLITDGNKMEEVKVVLEAIRMSHDVPQDSPLRKLSISDIEPNIKRQKTYEMTTKVNAMATLLSHGFSLEDTVNSIPFFDDPNEVCSRSGKMVREYQDSVIKTSSDNQPEGGEDEKKPNHGRMMEDLSDNIDQSPMIDKDRTNK